MIQGRKKPSPRLDSISSILLSVLVSEVKKIPSQVLLTIGSIVGRGTSGFALEAGRVCLSSKTEPHDPLGIHGSRRAKSSVPAVQGVADSG